MEAMAQTLSQYHPELLLNSKHEAAGNEAGFLQRVLQDLSTQAKLVVLPFRAGMLLMSRAVNVSQESRTNMSCGRDLVTALLSAMRSSPHHKMNKTKLAKSLTGAAISNAASIPEHDKLQVMVNMWVDSSKPATEKQARDMSQSVGVAWPQKDKGAAS